MKLVITQVMKDHRIKGYDYETGKEFCWSEATFIKNYEKGCKFWQVMSVIDQSEIPAYADLSTVTYNSNYGCYTFLVQADVSSLYKGRRKYVFFRNTVYGTHYFCKVGVESSQMWDAKVFDETDVHKQLSYMKAHPVYKRQGWKYIVID